MQHVASAPLFHQAENLRTLSKGSAKLMGQTLDSWGPGLGSPQLQQYQPVTHGQRQLGPSLLDRPASSTMTTSFGTLGRAASFSGLQKRRQPALPYLGLDKDLRYARGIATIAQCKSEKAKRNSKSRQGVVRGQLPALYTVSYAKAYAELEKQKRFDFLHNLFLSVDEDGSGDISLEEFQRCVTKKNVRDTLIQLGIQPHETVRMFKRMDDGDGKLIVKEFMVGLAKQQKKIEDEARAQGLL